MFAAPITNIIRGDDEKMYALGGGAGNCGVAKTTGGKVKKAASGRCIQTPDVRVTKKKLKQYMSKSDQPIVAKREDRSSKSFAATMLKQVRGVKGEEDFQALLEAELENENNDDYREVEVVAPLSRMSRVSDVSKLTDISTKTDLSSGSMLRWKTGMARKRKEKAQQIRDTFTGRFGSDDDVFSSIKRVNPDDLGYELPF